MLLRIIRDHHISTGMSRSVNAYRERRTRALDKFPHTVKLAEEVRQLKEDCIGRLDELVHKAAASLKENGAQVYYTESAIEALETIGEIVGSGKVILSGKTLTGEEIGLRHHLQGLGNEFWETDAGELIQQLRAEKPLHYLCPSPHVTREQVAELLTNLLHREVPCDISVEVRTIREFLLVLSLGRSYGKEQLEQAMRQALDEGRPGYERVRQLITGSPTDGRINQPCLEKVKVILPDTGQFDRLWRVGDHGEVVA